MMTPHAAPAARARSAVLRFTIATLLTLVLVTPAGAAESAAPGNRLELGFEERARTENWDNSTDFNVKTVDARHQWRFRTRLWEKLSLGTTTEFALGVCNESKQMATPHQSLLVDETVLETCYLDHRFAGGFSVRAGRQNLAKGDGFILTDGSPLDGSRVAYFNALDLAWTAGKSRLDLLALSDPYRDRYVPPIHDKARSLIEYDENAFGLYWSDAGRPRTVLDLYYFFKTQTGDTRAASSVAHVGDRYFHTLGARWARDFPGDWSVKVEAAGQAGGQKPHSDIVAWATQASVRKAFPHPTKPSLMVGWTGLSGDDPATTANEGWDPLFSRYPKWSELFIYTLGSERGGAYWTNLTLLQAEARMTPVKALDLRATYYRMGAFHPFPGKASIYAKGLVRGDLFEGRADYQLCEGWKTHVVAERMAPGGFYAGTDPGWFFRFEVSYAFKRTFGV